MGRGYLVAHIDRLGRAGCGKENPIPHARAIPSVAFLDAR